MEDKALSDKPPQREKNGNGKVKRKLLGPDQDVEDHVHAEWWRTIFSHLYLKPDMEAKGPADKPSLPPKTPPEKPSLETKPSPEKSLHRGKN
jgi:hypothetical protein